MEREPLMQVLQELHPNAFSWSLHCCGGDRFEAEDVLHDVYVKVLEGSARFDQRASLKTWLFSVIRMTACETRRTLARRLRLLASHAGRLTEPGGEPGALERISEEEARARVQGLLGCLSRRQGEVLRLVFYHDLTVDQAADVMGISPGSARVHYERGKAGLRAALESHEVGHDAGQGRATDPTSL